MAEHTPMDEVADRLVVGGHSAGNEAPAFPDPLDDAYSIAITAAGGTPRVPDAETRAVLAPGDAMARAAGVLTAPVRLDAAARPWPPGTGPLVAHDADGPVAVVPERRGRARVAPGSRERSRVRGTGDAGLAPDATAIVEPLPADAGWLGLVWWSLRRRRGQLWGLLLLAAVGGLAALLLPLATQAVFAWAVPEGDTSGALAIILAFALASIGAAIVLVARNLLLVNLRDESDNALATGTMAHMLRLPASFFSRRSTGDVLNRVTAVDEARTQVADEAPALVIVSAFGLVNVLYLLAISPLVALFTGLAAAAVVASAVALQLRARTALQDILEARSDADGMLLAFAEAIVPIRVGGAEERALARWSLPQGRAVSAQWRRLAVLGVNSPVERGGAYLVVAVMVAAVALPAAAVTAGDFMAAYAAVLQLTAAVTVLTATLVTLSETGPTLQRAAPVLDAPVEGDGRQLSPGPLRGGIEFREVTFGYDTGRPPLVNRLSLSIAPGEFVALVGPSGGGKSTLMRLLLGFEQPWSGAVTFDGMPLSDLDAQAVRQQVGTVLQAASPFGDTIRDAIVGPRQISDDDVWTLLAQAGLADDVRRMADGLDTPIGEGGGNLSGGQRQRMMIARALAGDPPILMLDEATSALDNTTQEVVMRSILARPVTRVAVAHRLSTIARADRVVVIAGGAIVEEGTPDELLQAGGHFAALAARQEL